MKSNSINASQKKKKQVTKQDKEDNNMSEIHAFRGRDGDQIYALSTCFLHMIPSFLLSNMFVSSSVCECNRSIWKTSKSRGHISTCHSGVGHTSVNKSFPFSCLFLLIIIIKRPSWAITHSTRVKVRLNVLTDIVLLELIPYLHVLQAWIFKRVSRLVMWQI